jgi:predicted nuclease with TOPRIM domain
MCTEEEHRMRAQLTQRLQQLQAEFSAGQKMLADLEAKQAHLQQTLLRISGAIQVLEEELGRAAPPAAGEAIQSDGVGRTGG